MQEFVAPSIPTIPKLALPFMLGEPEPHEPKDAVPPFLIYPSALHTPEPEAEEFTHPVGNPVSVLKLDITAPTGHAPIAGGADMVGLVGGPHVKLLSSAIWMLVGVDAASVSSSHA